MRSAFEIVRAIVENGESRVFKNWQEHSNITKEDFLEAMEWLLADPMDKKNRMTREIGLEPAGIVKLRRSYGTCGVCTFYHFAENGKLGTRWNGAVFTRPATEKEKEFFGTSTVNELKKISLSCKDRI